MCFIWDTVTHLVDAGQVVKRAEDEDLNKDVRYHVAFIKNPQGRVITDVSPQPHLVSDTHAVLIPEG